MHRLLVFVVAGALGGCSSPINGTWESYNEVQCPTGRTDTIKLDIADEQGDGDVCDCSFDFDVDDRGDDRFRLDMDFEASCGIPDGKYDCHVERDGERLDCGPFGNFEKRD
jgi:hypothetical protein